MKKTSRAVLWALFAVYCLLMVWLLFLHRASRMSGLPYWETIKANMNLVPFRTIRLFYDNYAAMPRLAMINLAGNVIMFAPLGIFLPCLWRRQRRLWLFLLTVAGTVIVIEAVQLFTAVGSCDVDDLILNVLGAAAGFGIYSLPPVGALLKRLGWIRRTEEP